MTKFVETFIKTKEDGHVFYNFEEQEKYLGHQATSDDVVEYIENVSELKFDAFVLEGHRYMDPSQRANTYKIIYAFCNNAKYHEKAIKEAVAYILSQRPCNHGIE